MLSNTQIEQYSRQIILPGVGGRGQERLLAACITIVGSGLVTDTAATYLAAAGVGHLALVGDNAPTSVAAVSAVNPDCQVASRPMTTDGIAEAVRCSQLVLGAEFRAATGPILNLACLQARRPLIWAAADHDTAHVTTLCDPGSTAPCLACLRVPRDPLRHEGRDDDPLAELAAVFVGCEQATEAVVRLLGLGVNLCGRLRTYDARKAMVFEDPVTRNPACAACGTADADPRQQGCA